jgi:hypothetical protein
MRFFAVLLLGVFISGMGFMGYSYLLAEEKVEYKEVEKIVEKIVDSPRVDLAHDKKDLYDESASVVGKWNALALEIIAGTQLNPPEASYFLAILHIAMFEAVNSVDKFYEPYYAHITVEEGVTYNKEVVVASAAQAVVDHFYPNFQILTEQEVTKIGVEDSAAQALGRTSAEQVIALREGDGADGQASYGIREEIGFWQATPPYYESPLLPHWGSVKTFVEKSAEYYPTPPHGVDTEGYAKEYEEVKKMGGLSSTERTEDQSEIAKFWADGKGTYTPPGHWNVIMHQIESENRMLSLEEEARCFALLNIAMADAGIQTWKAKFAYEYWRPVDAIHMADKDGNDATNSSTEWFNYIATPNFPEYPSGHSAFSGAGATVLDEILGERDSFETYSLGLPGVTRKFSSFQQAADEAGMSRIYGGIHFQKANTEGLRVGGEIGKYVATNLMKKR